MAGEANLITATDDIFKVIKDAWDAGASDIVGNAYTPPLVFEPLEADYEPHPRVASQAWGRVSVRHTSGTDAAIGRSGGKKRFRRAGFVTVECFYPYVDGSAWGFARRLAMLAQAAYQGRGTPGGVTFSGVRVAENGKSGSFYLCTVLANFRWDETVTQ